VLIASLLLIVSILPRVEDPWPERIGFGFPIVMAGAGGVVASVLFVGASEARRDKAVRYGGLCGLGFGALLYVLSVFDSVIFR
jgi:hypothetical protein